MASRSKKLSGQNIQVVTWSNFHIVKMVNNDQISQMTKIAKWLNCSNGQVLWPNGQIGKMARMAISTKWPTDLKSQMDQFQISNWANNQMVK